MTNQMEDGVTSIDDHVKDSGLFKPLANERNFGYKLSDKGVKSKLMKGAKRTPFLKEENSTSTNLVFSVGAWHQVVMPSIEYWKQVKADDSCYVGDYIIKIGGIKLENEINGKNIDTQIVFFGDRDKIMCHLYNTTQLILINGHGYRKFIELFLQPFFQTKIESCRADIQAYNDLVLDKMGPKTVKRSTVNYNSRNPFSCNRCDYTTQRVTTLNKHKKNEHTPSFNSSHLLQEHRQSTRNNSVLEQIMNEEVSITNLSVVSNKAQELLKYICLDCNLVTKSKPDMDGHVQATHGQNGEEEVKYECASVQSYI